MKSRNIGFDLDDVLLNFSDAFRLHVNKALNKKLKRKDMTSFWLEDVYGVSSEEIKTLLMNFYEHKDHINCLPIKGSIEGIQELAKNNNLYIITAKPDHLEKITNEWVNKHFPNSFINTQFANSHYNKERSRKKSEICKELNIEIFVDDSIDNAIDLASEGIPVLLPDMPWNQVDKLPPLVTRVYSWEEIIEHLR